MDKIQQGMWSYKIWSNPNFYHWWLCWTANELF